MAKWHRPDLMIRLSTWKVWKWSKLRPRRSRVTPMITMNTLTNSRTTRKKPPKSKKWAAPVNPQPNLRVKPLRVNSWIEMLWNSKFNNTSRCLISRGLASHSISSRMLKLSTKWPPSTKSTLPPPFSLRNPSTQSLSRSWLCRRDTPSKKKCSVKRWHLPFTTEFTKSW